MLCSNSVSRRSGIRSVATFPDVIATLRGGTRHRFGALAT